MFENYDTKRISRNTTYYGKIKNATLHCTTSNRRTESVAEHSWRISLMAYMLKSEFKEVDISLDKKTVQVIYFIARLDISNYY